MRTASAFLYLAVLSAMVRVAPAAPAPRTLWKRGDSSADGSLDLSDAVFTLNYLFLSGPLPPCLRSADSDGSGGVDLTDPIFILNHLFLAGLPPGAPYPGCGRDGDALSCDSYPPCEFESLVAAYSILRTVAGKGEPGPIDANRWEARFEGGPAAEAQLSTPHMAMGDGAGNIYIADKDASAIRKVTPEGRIFTVAGTGVDGDDGDGPALATTLRLNRPNGLWVRHDGTVFILDTENGKVRRLDPSGQMSTLFADRIETGRGLWVRDDEALIYYSSKTVLKRWSPQDGPEPLAGGFLSLGNIAMDPGGSLVATDRGDDRRHRGRVFRIESDGSAAPIAGNGGSTGGGDGQPALDTGLHGVRGVWFLPGGGYFLATHQGSQVWYVDTRGTIHLFLDGRPDNSFAGDGEHFRTPGPKVSNIRGISVDFSGNLLITENDYGLIRMVKRG